MTKPQVGVNIRPCGACGEYVWLEDGCPHAVKRVRPPEPRGGEPLKYQYPPGLDAAARRRFRQRVNAKRRRDARKISLTSGNQVE